MDLLIHINSVIGRKITKFRAFMQQNDKKKQNKLHFANYTLQFCSRMTEH